MQELRLVGIADDGEHLLLTGDGERYKLALDDELRTTVRRDRRVTVGGAAASKPASPLRPRDVQGLIRGGVPLEEIAERAGWTLDKVQRYEGPIRAERDYVSERAQAVVLPSRTETVTLRERAAARLADRGVEAERVVWDSWKTDETHWTVVVRFPAGGRLREATWLFDPVNHNLRTVDDEARWLGGDELASAGEQVPDAAAKATSTQRKRQAARSGERPAKVYDVEAEGGVADAQSAHLGSTLGGEDLTASMRARQASRGRAQRGRGPSARATALPVDAAANDATPVERLDVGTTPPPAPSHPRPVEANEATETEAGSESGSGSRRRRVRRARGTSERGTIGSTARGDEQDDGGLFGELPGFQEGRDDAAADVPTEDAEHADVDATSDEHDETSTISDGGDAGSETTSTESTSGTEDAHDARPDVPERASKNRSGRPSVPSWDDIMFGGRGSSKN